MKKPAIVSRWLSFVSFLLGAKTVSRGLRYRSVSRFVFNWEILMAVFDVALAHPHFLYSTDDSKVIFAEDPRLDHTFTESIDTITEILFYSEPRIDHQWDRGHRPVTKLSIGYDASSVNHYWRALDKDLSANCFMQFNNHDEPRLRHSWKEYLKDPTSRP